MVWSMMDGGMMVRSGNMNISCGKLQTNGDFSILIFCIFTIFVKCVIM